MIVISRNVVVVVAIVCMGDDDHAIIIISHQTIRHKMDLFEQLEYFLCVRNRVE